jgi:prepilin-type processing-associated H-X9-DG protein
MRTRTKLLTIAGVVLGMMCFVMLARAFSAAREAARRCDCINNLKWIALGLHNYHEAYKAFPTGTVPNPEQPADNRLSWVVLVYEFLGGGTVLQIDRSKGFGDLANFPPRIVMGDGTALMGMTPADMVRWVKCPDEPDSGAPVLDTDDLIGHPLLLTYPGIAGVGPDAPTLPVKHPRAGVFGYDRVTSIADITDGTSRTLLLVESEDQRGPWTCGRTSVRGVDPATRPHIGRGRPFGGYHPGGANVAMADGSVRFVKETVDPRIFEALATIAGGETVPADW